MWKPKPLSFLLAILVLFATCGGIVAHAEEGSAWTELLEYSTVNDSGQNWFKYTSTATVSIPTPYSMRLTKIDLLITYPTSTAPTKVEVYYNGTYYALEMRRIDSNTSRVIGTIQQNFYSDVRIRFTRSSTAVSYLEILSCRVSQIVNQEVVADAQVVVGNSYFPTGTNIEVSGNEVSDTAYSQIRIDVADWMKYDTITIWGSATTMGLSSVRATVGTVGLPFEMSYIQTLATGETADYTYRYTYNENYSGGGGYGNGYGDINTAVEYNGKILFCITIDLSGVDRTLNYNGTAHPMYVYLTGVYAGLYGYSFNCQYVNGSIEIPDKTEVTWWNRFTKFMRDLMNPNSSEADAFQQDAEQQAGELEDMNQQLEQIQKPPVEDIQMGVDGYVSPSDVATVNSEFGNFTQHPMVLAMTMISLTVALVAYILYGKR